MNIGGSNQVRIKPPIRGLELPKIENVLTPLPNDYKSLFSSNKFKERTIDFTGVVTSDTISNYFTLRDNFQTNLYQKDEETDFTLATFESPSRIFKFKGSIENIGLPIERLGYSEFELSIRCSDPFLYAPEQVEASLNFTQAGVRIPFRIPHIIGGDATNSLSLNNTGNFEVYCSITIQGPGKNFTIQNQTTGKSARLGYYGNDYYLGLNQSVTIDGQAKRVTENESNRFNFLTSFEALKLIPGSNTFIFAVESNNSSETMATVIFTPKFSHI